MSQQQDPSAHGQADAQGEDQQYGEESYEAGYEQEEYHEESYNEESQEHEESADQYGHANGYGAHGQGQQGQKGAAGQKAPGAQIPGQHRPGQKPQPNGAMVPRSKPGVVTHGSHPSQIQMPGGGDHDWSRLNESGHHAANEGMPIMGPHGHKVFASHLPHGSHQEGMQAMHMIYQRGWDDSHTKSLGHVMTVGFAYFGHWMGFC